jgi:hypothetical protein
MHPDTILGLFIFVPMFALMAVFCIGNAMLGLDDDKP